MSGRGLLRTVVVVAALAAGTARAAPVVYPEVRPGGALAFPADSGAHPEYRTEWWYVTGWLRTASGTPLGFQVTFFRTRPPTDPANPSAFAAHQLLIAHAALSDAHEGAARHVQRIARTGFGLAEAAVGRTDVHLGRWQLQAVAAGYDARVEDERFAVELRLASTVAPVANGVAGYSRKGPAETSASRYYSEPRLAVSGTVRRDGRTERVVGDAWLDHEWSSAYLDAASAGWDWVGLHLDDGGALMAFRIRGRDGAGRWAGGTLRAADGTVRTFRPEEIEFRAGRAFRSPRTGIAWPVEWTLRAADRTLTLTPLLDDQESDSRATTGAVYWEGAVRVGEGGRPAGHGYLELTGYGEPLRLP